MKTPKELRLPKKFQTWREGQAEAIEAISASEAYAFLLDAPTGVGKTLIGVGAHQSRVLHEITKKVLGRLAGRSPSAYDRRCIYITRTKQLQDQLLADFPFAKSVKGRNNYLCLKHPEKFPNFTAEHCTHHMSELTLSGLEENPSSCEYRSECPYFLEKIKAVTAPLAVLNTAYFLSEVNGPRQFNGADLLIIDEIDSMENALMNHVQFSISEKQLKRFNIKPPANMFDFRSWIIWADRIEVDIMSRLGLLQSRLNLPDNQWTDIEIEAQRSATHLENFLNKIRLFVKEVNDNWVFTFNQNENQEWTWTFKPVMVAPYALKYLWCHAQRVLGMSSTIFEPEILVKDIGLGFEKCVDQHYYRSWEYKKLDSPFPIKNRPIYYTPVVDLVRDRMAEELPKLVQAVKGIIAQYPNNKILIHTVSYSIRDYLLQYLGNERVMTHTTENRELMLSLFKQSKIHNVMLSPSFDRGVDLPQEDCRCVIICKVPYLDLGDPQIKARMEMPGGQAWYLLKAAQTLVQMSGRAVRSVDDYCDTYILDRQFSVLLARIRYMLPKWWLDAIIKGV